MNAVMVELQAAVLAAGAGSSGTGEIPEGAESFSDVLQAQKELAVGNDAVTQAVENGEVDAEMPDNEVNQEFSEILNAIENSDECIKESLMKLLETVLKAFRGADDDKSRKTDMFMMFSDGSAGMFSEDDEDMLLSVEILSQTGVLLEKELASGTDADELVAGLEDFVIKALGKDSEDTDAAEILSAMLGIPTEQLAFAGSEEIENAVKMLTAPKESLSTELAEKAEILFVDYKVTGTAVTEESGMAEMMKLSFQAVKINNASEQVETIAETEKETSEISETADLTVENLTADVMATGVQTAPAEAVSEPVQLDAATADSVEIQIREVVSEKLMSIESDNGTEELTMILKPENLGEVAVKLIKENGAVTVLISAQNDEVGKLMSDRAGLLGTSLRNQNFDVRDVRIVDASNAMEQMGLDFTNQGFGFMQNNSGNRNGSSYGRIDGIEATEETESTENNNKLKEAKLWATA